MLAFVVALVVLCAPSASAAAQPPVRIGIAGLVMLHADGVLRAVAKRDDILVVGVYEPDPAVRRKYADRYKLDDAILFADLGAMLDRSKPDAVVVFTTTWDHLMVTEVCAAHGIAVVTMEKPLAVNMEHARKMQAAEPCSISPASAPT